MTPDLGGLAALLFIVVAGGKILFDHKARNEGYKHEADKAKDELVNKLVDLLADRNQGPKP